MPREEGVASSPTPAPFLTQEQREALDQALRDKAQEQAKARAAANHKAAASSGERKSRSVKGPGGAKKGGGGGKYTWGALLTADGADAALDRNDPNYDSEEDERHVVLLRHHQQALRQEVAEYKERVRSIVEEYFLSGSVEDVAASLEELGGCGHLAHYFVKRLLTAALDRKDREREMASQLLSSLYAEVISPDQVLKGFTSLFASLPDLVLDVPDAPHLLARFTARAVVDDVLPPAVVTAVDAEADPSLRDLRTATETALAGRHSAEKVLRCWGGAGTGSQLSDTRTAVSSLLAEYLASRDGGEASRRLRDLGLPFFAHELVKQALVSALESPQHEEAVVALLARLTSSGEVSPSQLAKGVRRVADNLADAVLDCPAAGGRFAQLAAAARSAGVFADLTPEDVGPNAAAILFATAPPSGAATPPAAQQQAAAAAANGNGAAAAAAPAEAAAVPAVSMPPGVSAFKSACVAALREYYESQDAGEVANRLLSQDDPGLHPLFVKAALSLALDRRDRERELTSSLLVALVPGVVSRDALASGFTRLLASVDDLLLDVPDAVRLVALFLGRAVVDELLPPAFLTQVLSSLDASCAGGVAVVRSAGILLGARHGTERLVGCWRGGALEAAELRQGIRTAIREYDTSGDVGEVSRCLRELGATACGHEVVLAAVELAFSRYHGAQPAAAANGGGAADADAAGPSAPAGESASASESESLARAVGPVSLLLRQLVGQGLLSADAVAAGVGRARSALGEEVLDYGPSARAVLEALLEAGRREGWLPEQEA